MKKIGYEDLQLEIEKDLQRKIGEKFESIRYKIPDYSYEYKRLFNDLYVLAIDISEHYAVRYIIERIERNLLINESIRVFLFQSETFKISCFPKKTETGIELNIFVSQSFFNNLNEDEQVGIIGHEISHFLFKHLDYPIKELIKHPFELEDIGSFKADILYWAKVREISADIVGLVANGFNNKAYSTVIIKHFTGLSDSSQSKFNISPLVDIVLKQYSYLGEDIFFSDISSIHPTMPLRVKIINEISQSKLIKFFGEEVPDTKYREYKKEYNNLIDSFIKKIYPELYKDDIDPEIIVPMSLAVILADGKIEERELKAFKQIEKMFVKDKAHLFEKYKKQLFENNPDIQFSTVMAGFIQQSIDFAKRKGLTKHAIAPVIRVLLLVASSDEIIDLSELDCIYQFANEFGFTRNDIVGLIKTQYKL